MAATKALEEFVAIGRRKNAIASARLRPGEGKIIINRRPFEEYFPMVTVQNEVIRPLEITNTVKNFDIVIRAKGGGVTGQAGAIALAISRALIQDDAERRPELKAAGLLRRDPRMKERKKTGQPGARKRFQFSKR
jgi:small subunit ribosomal protein S9